VDARVEKKLKNKMVVGFRMKGLEYEEGRELKIKD
jgi:hypothetical protein